MDVLEQREDRVIVAYQLVISGKLYRVDKEVGEYILELQNWVRFLEFLEKLKKSGNLSIKDGRTE